MTGMLWIWTKCIIHLKGDVCLNLTDNNQEVPFKNYRRPVVVTCACVCVFQSVHQLFRCVDLDQSGWSSDWLITLQNISWDKCSTSSTWVSQTMPRAKNKTTGLLNQSQYQSEINPYKAVRGRCVNYVGYCFLCCVLTICPWVCCHGYSHLVAYELSSVSARLWESFLRHLIH